MPEKKSLTTNLKLVQTSLDIENKSAQIAKSLAFFPRDYLVTGFPYSKPDELYYVHQVNKQRVTLQGNAQYGLPYGSLPRLLLSYLATEAKKSKSQHIKLPRISEFCKQLDMIPSGGEQGTITQIKKQLLALFNTSFSFTHEFKWVYTGINFFLIEEYKLWTDKVESITKGLGSYIQLSKPFYSQIIEHGIPFDLRALKALKRSPLQMDLYLWLCYRLHALRKPTLVPWISLKYQFGKGYANDPKGFFDFRRKLTAHLQLVINIYFEAKISLNKEGLLLSKSPKHVN